MGGKRLLLVLALTATAANASPPLLAIADIQARHEKLNNTNVRVRGWLTACQPLGCVINERADEKGKWLGLGHGPAFDRSILAQGGRVLIGDMRGKTRGKYLRGRLLLIEIEGRVDRTCFDHANEHVPNNVMCFDRAGQILNPRLIKVIKAGPVPKQGRH